MGPLGRYECALLDPYRAQGEARWLSRFSISWINTTPAPVTTALRRLGINVLTVQEAGRCSLPDPDQLAFATSENRVMVSFDTDFLALHQSGLAHTGIAWCPQQKYRIGMLIQLLELLYRVADRDQMRNRVEYL